MRLRLPVLAFALFLTPALAHAEAVCIPGSSSTVFNASHDLNKVLVNGVRYANVKPNEAGIDSAPGLNAAIAYVVGNPACSQLTLDSGSYDFRAVTQVGGRETYLLVSGGRNLSIDFRNAEFLFKESYISTLTVENCADCSIQGFSIDYVHLPFTELAVAKVSEQHQFILAAPLNASWPNPQQLYDHQVGLRRSHSPSAVNTKMHHTVPSQPLLPPELLAGFDTRDGTPQYGDTC